MAGGIVTAVAKGDRWPSSRWREDPCHNRRTWPAQRRKPTKPTFRADSKCRPSEWHSSLADRTSAP